LPLVGLQRILLRLAAAEPHAGLSVVEKLPDSSDNYLKFVDKTFQLRV
jgi:hypothetical protein